MRFIEKAVEYIKKFPLKYSLAFLIFAVILLFVKRVRSYFWASISGTILWSTLFVLFSIIEICIFNYEMSS